MAIDLSNLPDKVSLSDLPDKGVDLSDLPDQGNKSALSKIAESTSVPERYERGGLVGIERLFTGDQKGFQPRLEEASERAQAATKPGYQPQPGEKIAANVAEYNDPRFLGLGEAGAAMFDNPLAKVAVGGAMGMGGSRAAEDLASTGKLSPTKELGAAAVGVGAGLAFHGAAVGVSEALKKAGNSFVDWMAQGIDETLPKEQQSPISTTADSHDERVQAAIGNVLTGKQKAPNIIDPTRLPPPPGELSKATDIKSDKETVEWLGRVQRLAFGPQTALDIALQKTEHIQMTPEAIRTSVMDETSRGKSVPQIAEESALPQKAVQSAVNMSDPVNTKDLAVDDLAHKGDPASQLNILQKAWRYWTATPTEASSTARNLYRRRYEDINSGHLESHIFIMENTGKLTTAEKQALPFIIEGKLPELDKFSAINPQAVEILDTARQYLADPSNPKFENLAQAHKKVGAYYDEGWDFLNDNLDKKKGQDKSLGYVDDYVNHIWKRNKATNMYGPGFSSLSTANPSSKQRIIGSYADGINKGDEPETLDISELLRTYDRYKIKTIANKRFKDLLENVVDRNGVKVVLPDSVAPPEFKRVDSPFFSGNRVSPEVYDAVNAIVSRPYASSNPGANASPFEKAAYQGVNAYEKINAVSKASKLSFGLVHYWNLTKVALAGNTNVFKVIANQGMNIYDHAEFDGIKDMPRALYKSFMEGHAAFENLSITRDAVEHGLITGSVGDFQRGKFNQVMAQAETSIKDRIGSTASKVISGPRAVKDIWDKALFDYFGSGIQIQMYYDHLSENIEKFGEKMPLEDIKRSTADFVNKANGKAMESLMITPKFRQAIHWAMLAPEWSITRLQTAGAMFKGGFEGGWGTSPEGYQAKKFGLRAAVAGFTFSNVMNYVNTLRDGVTDKDGKPGRFMWDNGDNWNKVYLRKDATGRDEYTQLTKAGAEVAQFFLSPAQYLGNRASAPIQMLGESLQQYKHTLTGFDIPKDQQNMLSFLKRNVGPLAFNNTNVGTLLPVSKGMSKSRVIELFESSIDGKDDKAFQQASKFGSENGYDIVALQKIAWRNFVQKEKKKATAQ